MESLNGTSNPFSESPSFLNIYPDANLDGYFRKDDGLKDFLRSGPYVLAASRLLHAFESSHSRDKCYEMIEDYAAEPFTEDLMREACGLPARKRSACQNPPLQIPLDPESQEAAAEKASLLWNVVEAIRDECLSKGKKVFAKKCSSI